MNAHSTPERLDDRTNEHLTNKQQKLSSVVDENEMEQIEISDEDDNLSYEIPVSFI